MTDDSEQARKIRAENIRKRIDQFKAGKDTKEQSNENEKVNSLNSETPTEFIHRRMEEFNNKKNNE